MDITKQNTITALLIAGTILSLIGPHTLPSMLAFVSLIVVFEFFFKLRNPIMLFILLALLYQWMQINVKVMYGNLVGQQLSEMFSYHQNTEFLYDANILSNIGLILFCFGVYLPLSRYCRHLDIRKSIEPEYNNDNMVRNYILISIGLGLLFAIRLAVPGLNTVIAAASRLKWGFLFLAVVYTYYYDRNRFLMNMVIVVEIILGFTGFFSAFKDIILIVIIALLSLQKTVSPKLVRASAFTFLFLVAFALVWTAIKFEFRQFLTGGERNQVVTVDKVDAIEKMGSLLINLKSDEILEAQDYLLDRLSYIEFFSMTLSHVPNAVPHQGGDIFKESVLFYFQPRILFPEKRKIDDSEHTSKYTGVYLTGDGVASHSIGFMTDAYIDFGKIGMMFLIFAIGLMFGYTINLLMTTAPNLFWGLVFTIPIYFLLSSYSHNMIKVMGNFITYIVPVLLFRKLIYNTLNHYFIK